MPVENMDIERLKQWGVQGLTGEISFTGEFFPSETYLLKIVLRNPKYKFSSVGWAI
jgi:hypothetical protein